MTEKIFDIETIDHILQESADELIICNLTNRLDAYFLLYRNDVWYDCQLFLYPNSEKDECEVINWDAEKDENEEKIKKEILNTYRDTYYDYIQRAEARVDDERMYYDE